MEDVGGLKSPTQMGKLTMELLFSVYQDRRTKATEGRQQFLVLKSLIQWVAGSSYHKSLVLSVHCSTCSYCLPELRKGQDSKQT